METSVIRSATLADATRIAEIYGGYVRDSTFTFELEPPGEDEIARRMRALIEAGFPYLVAEQAGHLVGYAYAGAYRPRPAYRFTVEHSIYLDPACTRRGIGKQLMAALIEECRSRGYRQMIAVIGDKDNLASIRLHEHFSFRHAGVLDDVGFKFDRWLDTTLMQREL